MADPPWLGTSRLVVSMLGEPRSLDGRFVQESRRLSSSWIAERGRVLIPSALRADHVQGNATPVESRAAVCCDFIRGRAAPIRVVGPG